MFSKVAKPFENSKSANVCINSRRSFRCSHPRDHRSSITKHRILALPQYSGFWADFRLLSLDIGRFLNRYGNVGVPEMFSKVAKPYKNSKSANLCINSRRSFRCSHPRDHRSSITKHRILAIFGFTSI